MIAGGVGTNGLKPALHGHFAAMPLARHNRTTIKEQAGYVQAGDGQRETREGLVTGTKTDDGIEHMPSPDQLNRGQYAGLITSQFLHGGWAHIVTTRAEFFNPDMMDPQLRATARDHRSADAAK